MKEYSSFETVKVSLAKELDGLDDEIDLGAGNWITFGYIPSDVQIFFALDNNSNSKIRARQGLQIKVPHSKVYLWSIGTNATEEMEIMHWGSDEIQMLMPPRSDFDSLNGYGILALAQLDKIINPYAIPSVTQGTVTSTSNVTMIEKTLNCDKLKVFLSSTMVLGNINLTVYIDNVNVMKLSSYWDANGGWNLNDFFKEFKNVRNKNLKIIGSSNSNSVEFYIEEYTLK